MNTPSGEPLEQVDTTFLGTGQEAGPAAPAPGWAVQVGAFTDEPAAEAQLTRAAERAPDEISRAIRRVTPFAWNNGRMFYRARFGGLDAQTAQAACAVLNRHGETCFVVADQIARPDHATLVEATPDPAPLVRHIESIVIQAPATVPVGDIIVADTVIADTVVAAPVKVAANTARPSLLSAASQVNNDELSDMRGGFFTAAGAHFDFGASVQTMVNGQLALQTNVQWTPAGPAVQQLSGLGASIQAQVASNLAKAGIGTAATNAAASAASNAVSDAANAGANAAGNVASTLTATPPQTPNAAAPATSNVTAPEAPATTVTSITPPTGTQPTPVTVGGLSGIQIPGATGGSTQVFANVGAGQIQNIILNSASNQTITQNTNVMLTIYNFPVWQQQLMQNAVSSQLAHDILAASGIGGH
ncbi:MAG: SPOR domain-containing protein [Rhizomicrobium sp.]